jgi:hypothetical protein
VASILKKIVGRFNPKGQNLHSEKIFVSAFGKHPGWDDHIDDIGLDTDILVTVKRILYVQGIGANIDCGSWEKLQGDQRLAGFKHLFAWRLYGNLVVGRMWSSQDGKGRTSYPMVVCVQCSNLPLRWVFENILPALERIEKSCVATTSQTDVKVILEKAQMEFRQLVRQTKKSALSHTELPNVLSDLAQSPKMEADREGLLRILYHIDREVTRYQPDMNKTRSTRATLLRVPVSQPDMSQNAFLWLSFLLNKFDKDMPVLALIPLEKSWIDIIIGEPTDSQLYCLRASLTMIPLTSSIPYNMGSEFVEQTTELIEKSKSQPNS